MVDDDDNDNNNKDKHDACLIVQRQLVAIVLNWLLNFEPKF